MAEFVLYNAPQSTCSQRVRYVLNAKGWDYTEIKLDLFSGDQLKEDYLQINPNGVVPSLVHNGKNVIDSLVILEYLEDVYPGVYPFRPSDPFEIAKMRAQLKFIDEVPGPAIRTPSYNLAFLPHFQAMTDAEFEQLCDSKPLRREFLKRMGRKGFSDAEMEEAISRLKRAVERMNNWIVENGGPWLLGSKLTISDIAIMPVIVRMDDINLAKLWADYPLVEEWFRNIKDTSAFEKTYYFGSLLTEKYPHLKRKRG
ncbi:MAG: glutathione S-transferase N-terminal domain-containing protein [Paracoccaceae bacterium]